ncbi:MAG: prepilin peptidase [Acidobacteria bacterium]|nr:prepilin peptidase [Acidobacteriota bacterium]
MEGISPLLAAVFVTGLVFGSFLNVCVHRIPREESVVTPPSRCPRCRGPIRPYDNIPLLSFVLLRGKCRLCAAPISWTYPLVELVTGCVFIIAYLRNGWSASFLIDLLFSCMIIVLVWVDYQHKILPDKVTLPGIVLGAALAPLRPPHFWAWGDVPLSENGFGLNLTTQSLTQPLWGALVGGGALWLVGTAYLKLRQIEGLGFGDVKMMTMVGAFLGWKLTVLTIFLGSAGGAVLGTFLILFKGRDLKHQLPFGSFLGVAALASLWAGRDLLRWYWGVSSDP